MLSDVHRKVASGFDAHEKRTREFADVIGMFAWHGGLVQHFAMRLLPDVRDEAFASLDRKPAVRLIHRHSEPLLLRRGGG